MRHRVSGATPGGTPRRVSVDAGTCRVTRPPLPYSRLPACLTTVPSADSAAPVLVTGTAAVSAGAFTSYAQLVLAGTGRTPSLTYTWATALTAGADRH